MGDITLALRTAQSGLIANQAALNTVSSNVANVNTEGYSRKHLNLKSIVVAGIPGGVQISEITRKIDEGLLRDLRYEDGELQKYITKEYTYARIQETFGSPGDNDSIAHLLESFTESIEQLAVTPEKSMEAGDLIHRAQQVLTKFERMSNDIQDLRQYADASIADEVSQINTITAKIDELNDDIIANTTIRRDTTDLKDQRDSELDKLSKIIDLRYFSRADGDVVVVTKGGRTLVDTEPPTLTHSKASSVAATSTHAEGDLNGIFVGPALDANDITNDIVEGRLKGLIDLRDSILPNLQAELDELASDLKEAFNQVHNRGTAFPGAQSLSGTRIFARPTEQTITLDSGGDDVSMVLFNSTGTQTAVTTLDTIMQSSNFGSGAKSANGPWAVSEVAATIEDWLQTNGASTATASIGTDGKLDITLNTTSLNLGFRDESATTNGSTNEDAIISFDSNGDGVTDETISGFSYFFGLNDFFVDTRADNMWESNQVASTHITPTSAQVLTFRDSSGTLSGSPLTVPASSTLSELATLITSSVTNITATVVPEGDGSRLRISHDEGSSTTVTQANGNTILTELGVHASNAGISSILSVRTDLVNSPAKVATARPQWDADLGYGGEYFMSSGDDTNIKALATLMTGTNTFEQAGNLPIITATFSSYAAELIATNSTRAATNERSMESQETLVNALQFKSDSVRGVNIDEEMADLLVFEQAYAAAARIISVIQNMIKALERAVD